MGITHLHKLTVATAQVAAVVEEDAKLAWLKERLPAFVDAGEVLVFAGQKARVEMVLEQLKAAGFR